MGCTQTNLLAWLDAMATQPLPGSQSAAAIGAAMGAALIAKAVQITQRRQSLSTADQVQLQAALDHAQTVRLQLVLLAGRDEEAFRAVLNLSAASTDPEAQYRAWSLATSLPVRVAEVCQSLLGSVTPLENLCWPAVRAEFQTGVWLAEVGVRAGLLAAEANLRAWGDNPESRQIQARIDTIMHTISGGKQDG